MFLRNMQANYAFFTSTFVIENPLPQNLLNIKKINSISKILVHALSNHILRFGVVSCYGSDKRKLNFRGMYQRKPQTQWKPHLEELYTHKKKIILVFI